MSHMRDINGYEHAFTCNSCGAVAGDSNIESEALERARHKVNNAGWVEFHPGWGLTCPSCQNRAIGERRTR